LAQRRHITGYAAVCHSAYRGPNTALHNTNSNPDFCTKIGIEVTWA